MSRNTKQVINDSSSEDENTLPVSDESDQDELNSLTTEEIIYPGLVLKNDYIILRKIGYGNNATVWMTYQFSTKLFLAMKIQDCQCYQDGCREVIIIQKINNYCKSNKDKNIYCVNMLDSFRYGIDDDKIYVCSVYELYAGSIHMILDEGKYKYGLPISEVKNITKQLLTALTVLHGSLKIIHTDIKTENILFRGMPESHLEVIDLFHKSGFQQKYENLSAICNGDVQKMSDQLEMLALDAVKEICAIENDLRRDEEFIPDDEDVDEDDLVEGDDDSNDGESEDDIPEENDNVCNERKQSIDDLLEHLSYNELHDLETESEYDFVSVNNNRPNTTDKREIIDDKYVINCQTALTDFGNAYFYEKRTRNEIQDRRYRAPEVVLDYNYGYACDIWSVSCVVFELLTGFVLFEPHDLPLNRDIHHLFLMEKILGPMPLAMKKGSKRNKFLFDKKRNYHIKNVEQFQSYPLKDVLVDQYLFSEEEADEISDFLLCGFKYNPSERLTADEMLKHPWLKMF